MAKFPTEVERSVTVNVPLGHAYQFLWDVAGSARCIPGIDACKRVGKDTYRFTYQERSTGPVSMLVRYTARYRGNGIDEISFEGTAAADDNTDVSGVLSLEPHGAEATRIVLRQMVAPDTPIPRLLQSLIKSFVEREAIDAVQQYLGNVKRTLEKQSKVQRPKSKG